MFGANDDAMSDNSIVQAGKGRVGRVSRRPVDPHASAATLLNIVLYHRRRWDMIRARMRLELQAQAILREFTEGDKEAAGKLWTKIKKGGEGVPLAQLAWVEPFMIAIPHFEASQTGFERVITKAVRTMPGADWAKGIRGVGDVSYAAVLAELAAGEDKLFTPADYRSPAAIWKRMGVGMVNAGTFIVPDPKQPTVGRSVTIKEHGRQRRITGDDALVHGYVAERRSILWNIGKSIIMQSMRKGEPIAPYGELYVMRRELERTKVESKAHAHNRAQRYVEKRFLRDLWSEWRKLPETSVQSASP